MLMGAIYAQLYGGPLDGLELSLPESWAEIHFPQIDMKDPAGVMHPDVDIPEVKDIVYDRGDPEHRHRYTWRRN